MTDFNLIAVRNTLGQLAIGPLPSELTGVFITIGLAFIISRYKIEEARKLAFPTGLLVQFMGFNMNLLIMVILGIIWGTTTFIPDLFAAGTLRLGKLKDHGTQKPKNGPLTWGQATGIQAIDILDKRKKEAEQRIQNEIKAGQLMADQARKRAQANLDWKQQDQYKVNK